MIREAFYGGRNQEVRASGLYLPRADGQRILQYIMRGRGGHDRNLLQLRPPRLLALTFLSVPVEASNSACFHRLRYRISSRLRHIACIRSSARADAAPN